MRLKRDNRWHGALLGRKVLRTKPKVRPAAVALQKPVHNGRRLRKFLLRAKAYLLKARGDRQKPYEFSLIDTLWSFIGGFIGMVVLAVLNIYIFERHNQNLLIGSLGASAMLVFGAPHAPFAQPRNVLFGHVFSALIGVWVQSHFAATPWLAAALAVALAIAAMQITGTMHPPGGATALIAVVGGQELKSFGYSYAVLPVGISAVLLIFVGVLINNISRRRRYPLYWW